MLYYRRKVGDLLLCINKVSLELFAITKTRQKLRQIQRNFQSRVGTVETQMSVCLFVCHKRFLVWTWINCWIHFISSFIYFALIWNKEIEYSTHEFTIEFKFKLKIFCDKQTEKQRNRQTFAFLQSLLGTENTELQF